MSTLSINHIKNKIKRQLIRFHHNKNKLAGNNTHMINQRDPGRPLLSLRAGNINYEESEEVNYNFDAFSAALTTISEGNEIQTQNIHGQELSNDQVSIPNDGLRDMEAQKNILVDSLKNNIHYIEKEPKRRKKFWLFGRNVRPKSVGRRDSLISLTQQTTMQSNDILIISLSSQEKDNDPQVGRSSNSSTYANDIIHRDSGIGIISEELKTSSFSRRKNGNSPFNRSVSSFTKEQRCICSVCERKLHKNTEPWRIVMNDISLQAALASTGSKPYIPLKSSQDIEIDLPSLKHQIQTINRINPDLEWIKFAPVPDDLSRLSIENDENITLDHDLLSLHAYEPNNAIRQNTQFDNNKSSTRPSTPYTKTLMILEPDSLKEEETSAAYDGVFQDYYYSDESFSKETLPLSFSSTKRLKQLI